jgi:CheY-like chemotaxis protein
MDLEWWSDWPTPNSPPLTRHHSYGALRRGSNASLRRAWRHLCAEGARLLGCTQGSNQKIFLDKRDQEGEGPLAEECNRASTPRILIVDDDPIVLKALGSMLQRYDVEVLKAENGMQGFWLSLRSQPQLVITDYNMNQGSGHYLLSRIKSTPSVQHIPVVVFTGESISEGEAHAVRRDLLGRGQASAFVTKRNPATILKEIGRHIPLRDKS